MFSRILGAAILLLTFNTQIIFPHNLTSSKTNLENPSIHHPLLLETESSYYNDGINNPDFNEHPYDGLILDTANSDEERMARRLLPEDMSWMEKFLWGIHGIFRSGELTPQKRKSELALRRTMLTWHQRLGITTWFLMSATVLAGQLNFKWKQEIQRLA